MARRFHLRLHSTRRDTRGRSTLCTRRTMSVRAYARILGMSRENCHEFREDITMIICDLCGQSKDCLKKEIDGKEYDICFECWTPLAEKLKEKGRAKNREAIFLPPRPIRERDEESEPHPGEPPKIQGTDRVHGAMWARGASSICQCFR